MQYAAATGTPAVAAVVVVAVVAAAGAAVGVALLRPADSPEWLHHVRQMRGLPPNAWAEWSAMPVVKDGHHNFTEWRAGLIQPICPFNEELAAECLGRVVGHACCARWSSQFDRIENRSY